MTFLNLRDCYALFKTGPSFLRTYPSHRAYGLKLDNGSVILRPRELGLERIESTPGASFSKCGYCPVDNSIGFPYTYSLDRDLSRR